MIEMIGKEPCSMKSEREKYLSGVGEVCIGKRQKDGRRIWILY